MENLQQRKKYKKDKVVMPQEWLHPREGKHINSVDSLVHHQDLVKETSVTSGSKANRRPERSVIEGYLSKKQITRWSGKVNDIQNNWNGTILFKGYFKIRFVPQNVQPTMPDEGDHVAFCLAFDRIGLSAWWVKIEKRQDPLDAVKTFRKRTSSFKTHGDDSSSDEKDDSADESVQQSGHFESNPSYESEKTALASSWQRYIGKRMYGVVISTEPSRGFGYLRNLEVSEKEKLFFHASQLVKPVISLTGNIEEFSVLEFQVEWFMGRPRATDINKVEVRFVEEMLIVTKKIVYAAGVVRVACLQPEIRQTFAGGGCKQAIVRVDESPFIPFLGFVLRYIFECGSTLNRGHTVIVDCMFSFGLVLGGEYMRNFESFAYSFAAKSAIHLPPKLNFKI
jgi:hypothetical protein